MASGASALRSGSDRRRLAMTLTLSPDHLQPIVALVAGVLILLVPRILNYIIAIYLIVVGILGLNLFH
jgi:hypothetical protein